MLFLFYYFQLIKHVKSCQTLNTNKGTSSYFRESFIHGGVMAEFDNVIDRLQRKFFIA